MGAALEFVRRGRNGWLVPAGDEEALFGAMRDAAMDELPRGARESVREHTLENGAERFAQYANKVVSRKGAKEDAKPQIKS
jgi:glycosyltransferase involved in cell wall biosynthesis